MFSFEKRRKSAVYSHTWNYFAPYVKRAIQESRFDKFHPQPPNTNTIQPKSKITKTDHPHFLKATTPLQRFKFTNMADVSLGACRFEAFPVTVGGGWRVNPASGSTTPAFGMPWGAGGGGWRTGRGLRVLVADRCSASHAASPRSTRISSFNPLVNDGLGV